MCLFNFNIVMTNKPHQKKEWPGMKFLCPPQQSIAKKCSGYYALSSAMFCPVHMKDGTRTTIRTSEKQISSVENSVK